MLAHVSLSRVKGRETAVYVKDEWEEGIEAKSQKPKIELSNSQGVLISHCTTAVANGITPPYVGIRGILENDAGSLEVRPSVWSERGV